MASRTLVSGLPRSLPPLPPGPAPTCVPCVEGRQRAAPHSSTFPPTEAPLQTLHMDVWGPARVRGQGHERYFLLVVDDYSRYSTVFPLRSKGEVPEVLIDWIRGARCQLSERFGSDLPVLRLHSNRGGEFSSDLLRAFCRTEGIRQTFTLPASPQQNGIAERRIGMVMDVARTSMIHAAAPHFLWPFAVQYAAHQINLQPRVSLPETTPSLRWTGKVGDASAFRDVTFDELVSYYRLFPYRTASLPSTATLPSTRYSSADKLSYRAVPCVFLGFPPDAPGWQFYHPTSRHGLSSQDVTFDELVSYYRLFPYRTASLPPPRHSSSHQVDLAEPDKVAVDSGAAKGAELAGAGTGGVEPVSAVPEHVEPAGAEPGGTGSWGAEPARAEFGGSPGGAAGAGATSGAAGPGAPGVVTGAGAARGGAGAGATGGAAGAGATEATAGAAGGAAGAGATGAALLGGVGAAGTGASGAAGVFSRDPGAEVTGAVSAVSGGAARPQPYYVLLLQQVLVLQPSPGPTPPLLSPPPVQSQSQLQPASPLPGPSPYSGPTRGLTERREPESRPVLPESRPASPASRAELPVRTVRSGRRVLRPRPQPVPGTHSMTLRPSTAPQRVPLPSPPASSLPDGPDPESDYLRAASPTVMRFLATAVTEPLFESTAASALITELVDFAAACRLDFATSLVAESPSESICPSSVGGECALGTDVLEDRQEEFECFAAAVPHLMSMLLAPEGDPDAPDILTPRSYAEAIEGPYSSHWQAAMDAEMASWKSTGTYVDVVPPPGANIVSGMWIFRVKRPPGSPPVFKARYVARGFSQRQGVDFFQTFSPIPKMTTLRVLLHVAARLTSAQPSYRAACTRRSGCAAHLASLGRFLLVLQRFGFAYSSPESTPLPTGHSLSAPPSDESVEPSGPYPELVSCLMYLMTCTRPDLAYPLSLLARYLAPGRHLKVHWDAAKRVLRYLCSTLGMGLVLGGWVRVVLTCHAVASWELRWLTYLLTDLGEAPRSPPVLYVDNKAMLALCQEHRLEHRTKHIALRYFLARELQQRGQLRLAYVASQANTADAFTKELQPCDHQRFCTVLGLVPTVPHLLLLDSACTVLYIHIPACFHLLG
ncbi:unnamed protein product [Closterium sp. NIES-54]